MTSVFLVHAGFEISLAFRNLVGFARREPRIRDGVRFTLSEHRMERFAPPTLAVNDFAPFSEAERVLTGLAAARPDVLALSCYIWNAERLLAFCERARALCPEMLVVAGGPEAGHGAERVLRRWPSVDVVVDGEGEETFRDVLLAVLDGDRGRLVGLPGTVTRGPDGRPVHGPPRAPLADLDLIPPAYEEELARKDPALGRFDGSLIYETLRGCVYKCGFCLCGKGLSSYRCYDEERVVAELGALLSAGHDVQVVDPIFGLDRRRTKRILTRLAELRAPGGLYLESYAELIDREMAELFVAAGVRQVGVGLQSTAADAIDVMGRRFKAERFQANLAHLGSLGVSYYVDVIYGLPGDTWETFLATLDFALGFEGADVEIYRLLALPGTRYHADAARHGLRFSPEPPYETYGCDTFPYADVLRANALAQTWKMLRRALGRPQSLAPVWRRHYDGSAARFLLDLGGWLGERAALDFLSSADVEAASFAMRGLVNDFLRERGLARGAGGAAGEAPAPEGEPASA